MTFTPNTKVLPTFGVVAAIALLAYTGTSSPEATSPAGGLVVEASTTTVAFAGSPRVAAPTSAEAHEANLAAFAAALDYPTAYAPDQIMVRPAAGFTIEALAASLDAEVLRRPGRSGYAALQVPAGTADAAMRALVADGRIASIAPMGRMMGANSADAEEVCGASWRVRPAHDAQWHLDHIKAPKPGTADLSGVTVAILDTGVAYEDRSDSTGTYVQAPSLADTAVVTPYDFVNQDEHAGDDNQHGTHIASVIASSGSVEGVAPGVSLMPLKVLDQNNVGTELMLIEALYYAADNGADVINMSLAFPEGYAPSGALSEALAYAADAGAVLVSASGNAGLAAVAYPAGAPQVIAVASSRLYGDSTVAAAYSNIGPKVDLMAPGGDLTMDENDDGIPDGIVAETIAAGDPSQTGLYIFSGTSQSAAMVSGAAAWLLAAGADADEVRGQLQNRAKDRDYSFGAGTGAGELQMKKAWKGACSEKMAWYEPDSYSVAVMPTLESDGDDLIPSAQVALYNSSGTPVKGQRVYVNLTGSTTGILDCKTNKKGLCTVEGDPVDTSAEGSSHAWAFSAEAVVKKDVSHQPAGMVFGSPAMEAVLAEMGNSEGLDGTLVAFYDSGDDGETSPAYTFVDLGTGLASSPLGIIATPNLVESFSTSSDLTIDPTALDGTGLASSPLGLLQPRLLSIALDGTGLASSPLGFVMGNFDPNASDLDGTGLASSPLGFTGTISILVFGESPSFADDADLDGAGLASSPLGFTGPGILDPTFSNDSSPLLMGTGSSPSLDLAGTATGDWLDSGGFITAAGYSTASLLVATSAIEVPAEAASVLPSGSGALALY